MQSMTSYSRDISAYVGLIMEACRCQEVGDARTLIREGKETIECGLRATLDEMIHGTLEIDEGFCLLDSSKAVAARNALHRNDARYGHLGTFDTVLSFPNPGTLAEFFKRQTRDTAILSFFIIGDDCLAVLSVRDGKRLRNRNRITMGVPGFGDTLYSFTVLDGLKQSFLASVQKYALSVESGGHDYEAIKSAFGFLATTVFMLLFQPHLPEEVVFIPHKLLHILPWHALSIQLDGKELFLHDWANAISYSSSFQEMALAGIRPVGWKPPASRHAKDKAKRPHMLVVSDRSAPLSWHALEEMAVRSTRQQLEHQGLIIDEVTDPDQLPTDYSKHIWINWSTHSKSSATEWDGGSLSLKHRMIRPREVRSWNLESRPVVVLAGCETAVDSSGGLQHDEGCGLDLAFRIAGAQAAVASLWAVSDPLAAFTAWALPGWGLGQGITPDLGLTGMQKFLRESRWKELLLREEQLKELSLNHAEGLRALQESLWNLPDEAFSSFQEWASFRCHGR